MDFSISDELRVLRERVAEFVQQRVIPLERVIVDEDRAGSTTTLRALQAHAISEGLWTPHLPKALGGLGLGPMGMCALFREMGRSPVGARVFNCDAPDQGNMDLLVQTATEAQQARWLAPLVHATMTSAFCMTEPAPGAGSDPSNLRTTAKRVDDHWVIDGHKWYSTGGGAAGLLLVMARTSDDPRTGATIFLVPRDAPGVVHVRDFKTMGDELLQHREAELLFEGVRVEDDAVLGAVGQGFALAQTRLVPARLTHCMRWLGLADRALSMCRDYLVKREAFGKTLAHHQMLQRMIAENARAIHAGNLMSFHCAWMLERGLAKDARAYSSMAKTHVAQLLCKVLDDAIQMHGGLGYSEDLPFSIWYRSARAARIADGPDEVHDMVVARDWLMGRVELLV
ncbi:MAG: acyl-CoA dehydrogenase family protein [Deltaproteobacteria bacterium]|nr:acyl-CoA dehydrogenase family protein [Deltaproteobacteria bacterium]